MMNVKPTDLLDSYRTSENRTQGKYRQYIWAGIFALWAALVLTRFFQVHPIEFDYFWRLVRKFRVPLPTSDLTQLSAAATHLALACLLALTGILAGRFLLKRLGISGQAYRTAGKWEMAQYLLLALGLGWGLLMYATFLLGVTGGLYPNAIWGLTLLVLVLRFRDARALSADMRVLLGREDSEKPARIVRAGRVLLWVMLALLLIVALAPSITHDAMVYHLNVPRVYATAHKIVAVPYNLFSNTVLNQEMLYTASMLIDNFVLANLVHYILGVAALAFLYGFVKRDFGGAIATLATLIFFFNPLVLNETPIAYADMGMTFYFLLAMGCLWEWKKSGDRRWFFLLCIFAGIFAGMKYTSIHGLAAICVMIAAAEVGAGSGWFGRTFKRLALLGVVVAVFAAPYLVKNYLITGNPVYPLMYNIFGGRWLEPRQVERMLAYVNAHGMGHDWRSVLSLPWNITVLGQPGYSHFDAVITPLWLILVPAFLLIRPKPSMLKWALAACAVYFVSWASSTHITRYLMPIFPLLSLISAYTIVTLKDKAASVSRPLSMAFMTGAALTCGLVWFSFAYVYPLQIPSEFGAVIWGKQTRDEFLTKKVPSYLAFKFINENLPQNARLIFFWDNRGFFCDRSHIGDSVFEAPSMLEIVHEAGSAGAFHNKLREMGIKYLLYNEVFRSKFPPYKISSEDSARLVNDQKILDEFLKGYCLPIFSDGGTTVYEVHS